MSENILRGDVGVARKLLNKTKDTYAEKIIANTDPEAIGWLLDSVNGIDNEVAIELLNKTKDTYSEKIMTDPTAIERRFESVRYIDEETAEWLEKETS